MPAGYVRWHNTRASPRVNFATDSPIRTWTDYPAKAAQSGELQGAAATVSHCQGWAQGDSGWGAVRADIAFAGAPAASIRITAVLARRPGGWKIVQFHGSVGAANEEVVGKELTV